MQQYVSTLYSLRNDIPRSIHGQLSNNRSGEPEVPFREELVNAQLRVIELTETSSHRSRVPVTIGIGVTDRLET